MQARREINRRLDGFIARGRADRSIRAAVNATDIIVFSALITQPLPHGPDWPLIAGRQLAVFINGLAASGPDDIPGRPVTRQDIETAFALRSARMAPGSGGEKGETTDRSAGNHRPYRARPPARDTRNAERLGHRLGESGQRGLGPSFP